MLLSSRLVPTLAAWAVAALLPLPCAPRLAAQSAGHPAINAARLQQHLEGLGTFGRPPGGTFADGVTRLAYSDADLDGRRYVMELMRAAGLQTRVDPVGNIVARREGRDPALPPILVGSHIDSVPNGGNFDGALGTLGALEALQALGESRLATRHPIELVVWVNEEGVAFGSGLDGSRAAAGEVRDPELDQVWNGVRKADAIRRLGGVPERLADARRAPGSIHAYLELHIEQGGTLARAGVPIGVVEGIVGIDRYEATIRGVANHAGTTPMADRHDALLAAARLALAVREVVVAEPGRQVGTVGRLVVSPNAPNVVPGLVTMTIELRDLSMDTLRRLKQRVDARAAEIARDTGTEIALVPVSHHEPALAAPVLMTAIEQAAAAAGLRTLRLPSGAGHDAQMAATFAPMGMIFVPSVGGVSHSPKEATTWGDCARGAAVLLQAVLASDRMTVR